MRSQKCVTVIGVAILIPCLAHAQPLGAPAPTTPWGAPDLRGIWDFRTITPLQRPRQLADKDVLTDEEAASFEAQENRRLNRDLVDPKKGGAIYPPESEGGVVPYNEFWYDRGNTVVADKRTSLIVDPPDGRLPRLTPAAQRRTGSPEARRVATARRGMSVAETWTDFDGGDRCIHHLKAGPPITPGAYNNNIQLFQTVDHVAILNEHIHDVRIIPLDGRERGQRIPQWMGDPRARWEDETLVVETVGFNGKQDQAGRPIHTGGEHQTLIERFTRVDERTLLYEYTVSDPTTWEHPWTARFTMQKTTGPVYEYACHEGNYGLYNILAGARAQRADATAAREGSNSR